MSILTYDTDVAYDVNRNYDGSLRSVDMATVADGLVAQWLTVSGVRNATRRELDSVPNGSHVVVRGVRIEPDMGPLGGRGPGYGSTLQHWDCVLYVAPFSHTGTAVDTTMGLVANAYSTWRDNVSLGLADAVVDSYIDNVQVTDELGVPKATSKYAGAVFDVVVRIKNITASS